MNRDQERHMARKKILTTIYLTPEQDERLKQLSNVTRVPMAVYIREGIDLILDRNRAIVSGQLELDLEASGQKLK